MALFGRLLQSGEEARLSKCAAPRGRVASAPERVTKRRAAEAIRRETKEIGIEYVSDSAGRGADAIVRGSVQARNLKACS